MNDMMHLAEKQVHALVLSAWDAARAEGLLPDAAVQAAVEKPRDAANGDYTSTFALAAAKAMGMKPRDIAQILLDHLDLEDSWFRSAETAGPG